MFRRVLVANRGEIALRIIRACHDLGIEAVAVYSDADQGAPYVRAADQAVSLGEPTLAESYLNVQKILDAATGADAEAVHPGYGLLSENAAFAQACEQAGLVFVGPPAMAIRAMGEKAEARKLVAAKGVPVIPGSEGAVEDAEEAADVGQALGYPIILKASAGGGGIGMRVVSDAEGVAEAFAGTERMARTAFGSAAIIVEKYLPNPRHVEIQVAADEAGRTIHLLERECSVQRRYQKLIEESPSMALNDEGRRAMGEAAVRVAEAVGYRNLGTVEFIFSRGDFFFLEMNTRLQVEHPVTEMITGLDLVHHQFRIAAGEGDLPSQDEVQAEGHAIECRINAEDPLRNFMPSPGTVALWEPPQGASVRVDAGVETGTTVPFQYDPLVAKLIVWGEDRDAAIDRMLRSLHAFRVEGIPTTIPFHVAALDHPAFRSGAYDTHLANDVKLG